VPLKNVELLRLGYRIRGARKVLGYGQKGFAVKCGLGWSYLGEVERGERNITFGILCAICLGLECDIATITKDIPHLAAAVEGNTVTHAWFDGKTDQLRVTSRSEVETLRTNASDYLLDPQASRLPPRYAGGLERLLAPYSSRAESGDHVDKFAQEIADEAAGNTLYFLDGLSRRLYETCSRIIRETGRPQEPALTLQHGRVRAAT
jgi:transcriptional regulator with XRE-family HTH domain